MRIQTGSFLSRTAYGRCGVPHPAAACQPLHMAAPAKMCLVAELHAACLCWLLQHLSTLMPTY